MLVLGVETSCDETAAAVVADGREVLSDVIASQVDLHGAFGGVVPEIACRAHAETITLVIDEALRDAGTGPGEIGAIAVTNRPGLIGALLVGVSAAKGLARATGKPLVGANHLEGHIYAARLDSPELEYPFCALVASGGHTSVYKAEAPGRSRLLGRTLDDAAGEAFDKVAAIFGLGYPGGAAIETAAAGGDGGKYRFARSLLSKGFDFSFSGLKTSVLYLARGQNVKKGEVVIAEEEIKHVLASFQEAVVDVLAAKLVAAAKAEGVGAVAATGGVASNARLRERLAEEASAAGLGLFLPAKARCLDNAAMIGGLGYHLVVAGEAVPPGQLDAYPRVAYTDEGYEKNA